MPGRLLLPPRDDLRVIKINRVGSSRACAAQHVLARHLPGQSGGVAGVAGVNGPIPRPGTEHPELRG